MKHLVILIAASTLTTSMLAGQAAAQGTSYKGEITDEKLNCVQTPLKAYEGVKDKTSCVLYWAHSAQPNSKFVLYDAGTKAVYQLDNQDLVEPYVGEKVIVTGTLNSANKTIKVSDIKVDESAYKK